MQRQARPHFLNYSLVVWIFWILGAVATPLSSVRADGPLTAETPRMIGPGPTVDSESLPQEEWGPADAPGQFERPTPEAPPTGTTIEGINFDEDAANNSGFFHIPPDPHGTAGPGHVVSIVNTSIEWFTKAGVAQNSQRLGKNAITYVGSFFEPLTPVNGTFDPKVIYDQYNDRFVVVTLELQDTSKGDPVNASRILLAVSDDSNPNGTWHYLAINSKINISGADRWADYPGFAVDEEAVYVTANMFGFGGGGFAGVRLWIITKGAGSGGFYDGGAASVTVHDPYASAGFAVTTQPAHMYGTGPAGVGTFLVSYGGITDGTNESVQVVRVDNPLTGPTFSQQFVAVGNIDNTAVAVPGAPQSGTANTIDAGDRRAINAVWRNNSLWFAADVVPGSGANTGQTTAHWWQINTTTLASLSVTQQGNVGGEDIAIGTHTFYPSVAVDGSGNMGIGFAASAPTMFPGAYYTGRLSTDGAGTVQPSGTLAAGVDFYFRTFSGVRNRWGDYSAITIDPSDDATFWVFNEYALTRGTVFGGFPGQDGRWGTRFGSFTFSINGGAIFADDMESGTGGWLATGTWGQTTASSHSPTHSWTDSPGGNYANNANASLWSPVLNFSGLSSVTLAFWHRYDLQNGFDFGNVWVTTDNGATFTQVASFTGTNLSWTQPAISLDAFAGQPSVRIVFQLLSNGSVTRDGWYIDDVLVLRTAKTTLVSAVGPNSRSVQVGHTAAAFALVLNYGTATALGCGLSPISSLPATFSFQALNCATNLPLAALNTSTDIPAGGAGCFIFTLTPSNPIAPTNMTFNFDCTNSDPAPVVPGVNTFLFSSSTTPTLDLIASALTDSNDAILNLPGANGANFIVVGTANVGSTGGTLTAEANTGGVPLPVTLSLCQWNIATASCMSPFAPSVTTTIGAAGGGQDFASFVVLVQGSGNIAFEPGSRRVFISLHEGSISGPIRGLTSVAVRTR